MALTVLPSVQETVEEHLLCMQTYHKGDREVEQLEAKTPRQEGISSFLILSLGDWSPLPTWAGGFNLRLTFPQWYTQIQFRTHVAHWSGVKGYPEVFRRPEPGINQKKKKKSL